MSTQPEVILRWRSSQTLSIYTAIRYPDQIGLYVNDQAWAQTHPATATIQLHHLTRLRISIDKALKNANLIITKRIPFRNIEGTMFTFTDLNNTLQELVHTSIEQSTPINILEWPATPTQLQIEEYNAQVIEQNKLLVFERRYQRKLETEHRNEQKKQITLQQREQRKAEQDELRRELRQHREQLKDALLRDKTEAKLQARQIKRQKDSEQQQRIQNNFNRFTACFDTPEKQLMLARMSPEEMKRFSESLRTSVTLEQDTNTQL